MIIKNSKGDSMRKIYTSIELGSFSIKILVCEMINNNPYVLALSNTKCKGIKNGYVVDYEETKNGILTGLKKIEDMLGFKVKEAVIGINSEEKKFDILNGEIDIKSENHLVGNSEIEKLEHELVMGNVLEKEELLSIIPISFQVDDKEPTKDPKGMEGNVLSLKAVIIKVPKGVLRSYLDLFKDCGIKVVDVTLSALGDYYEVRNKEFDSGVGAVINIGYDKIDVSVYNKGIMIKYETIPEGSKLIENDLMYMYHLKRGQARKIKENFAVGCTKYADVKDTMILTNKEEEEITINQLEVSEVIESRIVYLLKLAKKQLNHLTNREISNIIVTGGISELAGFSDIVEREFDNNTTVLDIKNMGARNNMYSTILGLTKYFNNKLDFKGITYSMIKEEEFNNIQNIESERNRNNTNNKDNNIINKVFGYFSNE